MQMMWSASFEQRMVFGASQAYVKQLKAGQRYSELRPVYALAIINSIFLPQQPDYYHHYKIVNIEQPQQTLKGLEFVFIELPKFTPEDRAEKRLQTLRTQQVSIGREFDLHRSHKHLRAGHHFSRIQRVDGIALVIGNQPHFFGAIERAPKLHRNDAWLHQMETERGNQTAVGFAKCCIICPRIFKQHCLGRVKHGVVRAIARSIRISRLEQKTRRYTGTGSFSHQRHGARGVGYSRTPSRAMFRNSAGFE